MLAAMTKKVSHLLRPVYHKQKMLISMLLLATIPVLVLGLTISNVLTSTIREQATLYNTTLLQHAQSKMNDQIKKIDELLLQYTYSDKRAYPGILAQFAMKELSARHPEVVRQLQNVLVNIRSGMEHVIELDFYSFQSARILTSDNHLLSEEEFRDPLALDMARHISLQGVWIDTRTSIPANKRIDRNVLTLIRPVAEDSTEKKSITGAIIAYLDADTLGNQMSAKNSYSTLSLFVVNGHGQIILDTDRRQIGRAINLDNLEQIKNAEPLAQIRTRLNGVSSVLSVLPSRNQDWYYISAISEDELNRSANQVQWLTIGISLSFVAIAAFLSLRAASNLYRPVRKLTQAIQPLRSSDQPAGQERCNEMDQVHRAIEAMIRENQQLESSLSRYRDKMEQHTLHQYLLGSIQEHDARADIQYGQDASYIAIMLLTFDTWKLHAKYPHDDQYLLYFAVENMALELAERYGQAHSLMMKPGQFAVFISSQEPLEPEVLKQASADLLHAIETYLQLTVTLSVSYSLQGLGGLPDAYKQAEQASRYRFVLHEDQAIFIHELDPAMSIQLEDIAESTYKIVDSLKASKLEPAQTEFIHLMEGLKEGAVFSVDSVHGFFSQLLGSILRCMQQHHSMEFKPELQRLLLSILSAQQTLGDVEAFFLKEVFQRLKVALDEQAHPKHTELIQRIVTYIHEHYDQDISLQQCADAIGLNTFQVSRLFKKHTGRNFVDYVITYRIDRAKDMLLHTDLRIQDIAEKLRYTSVQNFIRTFKKTTGTTPGQYRKHMSEQ
ncbi:AraC family transcriptional regulator [Paenibacillus profundus]|uniref:AraC family transcriptional regulator n=1 Tax=Paenibacillus profundus TaxID=1173085 RepID=A0ABS8YAE4_9BACL|nr:AraC family transcriptional regulator [Paenibacillus profundus]MCE5168332.1 AraC family transcriptional regulator [Paenibacillus profundus]